MNIATDRPTDRPTDQDDRPSDQALIVRWQESFKDKIQIDTLKNSGRVALEDHENCVQIGREMTKLLTDECCYQASKRPDRTTRRPRFSRTLRKEF